MPAVVMVPDKKEASFPGGLLRTIEFMKIIKPFLLFFPVFALQALPAPALDKGIYGGDDRKDIFEVSPAYRELARSVAAVMSGDMTPENGMVKLDLRDLKTSFSLCDGERFGDQPADSFCTAALVGPDLVLTAGHCVTSAGACRDKKFVFGYEMGANGEWPSLLPADNIYSCAEILVTTSDGTEDYAVIRLDRPVVGREPLQLDRSGPPAAGDAVFAIGTPLGLPLKVADNAHVRTVGVDSFISDLDTFGGNSGSPVFNSRGLITGVLIAGGQDLAVHDDACVISYVTAQNEGDGEWAASAAQFAPYIPQLSRDWRPFLPQFELNAYTQPVKATPLYTGPAREL